MSNLLSMIPAVIGAGTAIYSSVSANKQAKKRQEEQVSAQKEMQKKAHEDQYDMWKKTNFQGQMKEMKGAGINPGLLYGMGGTGGATTGAGNMGSASQAQTHKMDPSAIAQLGLMEAQKNLTEAQTEKTQAETAKTSGVDTKATEESTRGTKFQNDLNEKIGLDAMTRNYGWANDKLQIESERANADWESYRTNGYQGRTFDDKNSPIAKALQAGFEKTVEDLKKAKLENDAKKAENVVKEFEAGLAKQGISPNTPWGVKLAVDALKDAGILDLIKGGK